MYKIEIYVYKDNTFNLYPLFDLNQIIKDNLIQDKICKMLKTSFANFQNKDCNQYDYDLQIFYKWIDLINEGKLLKNKNIVINKDSYNNTYNVCDNFLDNHLEYCHIEVNEVDYIAIKKHCGSDIRGNYSNYEFYKINHNDFESFIYENLFNSYCIIPFKKLINPNNDVNFFLDFDHGSYENDLNASIDNNENLEIKAYSLNNNELIDLDILDIDQFNYYYDNIDNETTMSELSIIIFDFHYKKDIVHENQLELFDLNQIIKDNYDMFPILVNSMDNNIYFNGHIINKEGMN